MPAWPLHRPGIHETPAACAVDDLAGLHHRRYISRAREVLHDEKQGVQVSHRYDISKLLRGLYLVVGDTIQWLYGSERGTAKESTRRICLANVSLF